MSASSEINSPSQRVTAQEQAFRAHYATLIPADSANTDLNKWYELRPLNIYLEKLPTWKRDNLLKIIEKWLTNHPNQVCQVLDVGCGDEAVALSELQKKYSEQIEATGVTLPIERTKIKHPANVAVKRQDARSFLQRAVLNGDKYHVICSLEAWRYFADPLSAIKLAYQALAPEGILLIDFVYQSSIPIVDQNFQPIDPKLMWQPVAAAGYQLEVNDYQVTTSQGLGYSLALKKNELATLKLPIKILKVEDVPGLAQRLNKNDYELSNQIFSQFDLLDLELSDSCQDLLEAIDSFPAESRHLIEDLEILVKESSFSLSASIESWLDSIFDSGNNDWNYLPNGIKYIYQYLS